MLYDKTTIRVTERSMQELADLTLHVLRDHFKPIVFTYSLAVVPLMILNYFLIGWMANIEYSDAGLLRFAWSMLILIVTQSQLASIFLTYYLGKVLFNQKIELKTMFSELLTASPKIIWEHGLWRMVVPILALYMINNTGWGHDEVSALEGFFVPLLLIVALFVRAFRPFMNELLVLELNPLRSTNSSVITLATRSKSLHAPVSSELFGRAIFNGFIAMLMSFSFFCSTLLLWNVFAPVTSSSFTMNQILFPLCIWAAMGIISVSRFLSYLDIRTRQEGWEVELQLRAEAVLLKKAKGEI